MINTSRRPCFLYAHWPAVCKLALFTIPFFLAQPVWAVSSSEATATASTPVTNLAPLSTSNTTPPSQAQVQGEPFDATSAKASSPVPEASTASPATNASAEPAAESVASSPAAPIESIPSAPPVATPEALTVPATSSAPPTATETAPASTSVSAEESPVQSSNEQQNIASEEAPQILKAREHLRDFAYSKLVSMASKLCFTSTNHCIEQKEGAWVASYKDIAPETLIVQVKPVDGSSNRFVGLIKYAVLNFEARADSKSLLAQQEFQIVKRLWQTEILRYDGKIWK